MRREMSQKREEQYKVFQKKEKEEVKKPEQKPKQEKTITLEVKLPVSVVDALMDSARARGVTVASVIQECCERSLNESVLIKKAKAAEAKPVV